MITTTTSTTIPSTVRLRRRVVAVLAGAAIVASAGLVVSRAVDRDAPVGASTFESTLDRTFINGAIHVFTAPDSAVAPSPGRLVVEDAASAACSTGHADACPFTHTWAALPLPGIGDIFAGTAGAG